MPYLLANSAKVYYVCVTELAKSLQVRNQPVILLRCPWGWRDLRLSPTIPTQIEDSLARMRRAVEKGHVPIFVVFQQETQKKMH